MKIKITRPATTFCVDGEEYKTGDIIEGDESLLWLGECVDSDNSDTEEQAPAEETLPEDEGEA